MYQRLIVMFLFVGTVFSNTARCQTESFKALPSAPRWLEYRFQIPAAGDFKFTAPSPVSLERYARREYWSEQNSTGSSTQPQIQTQESDHQGLVMRSVKRTLQDQKELYRTPFKPSNFKWDALVLGGTAALLAYGPAH